LGKVDLRKRLAGKKPLFAGWLSLPGALHADIVARSPFEAVVIDMQHGLVDYTDMVAMLLAINAAGKPAVVRLPWGDWGFTGRALDAGAHMVIAPMINTADDAIRFVSAAKFPPLGERSWGPYLAPNAVGATKETYLSVANTLSLAVAMIETGEALDNVDAICRTPGLDGIFVGPSDLSISLSKGKTRDPFKPGHLAAIRRIAMSAQKHRVISCIYATTPESAGRFVQLGFRFVAVSTDATFMAEAAERAFRAAGGI
jgi:4-hydroxy-2-oxoheptanedioate aldolase